MPADLTLPAGNLHPVPDSITDEEACYAEPLAAACRIIEQKAVPQGSKAAVIGVCVCARARARVRERE